MILHTRGAGAGRRRSSTRRARASRRSTPICRSCTRRSLAESIARRADLLRPDGDDAVHLRRGRHGARRDGHLRAGVVHRQAEHARNRHPHGARRVGPVGRPRDFSARGLRLGAIGAALGIVAALGVSRLLGSVLFGVSATDAVSFARALAIVLGGVVVATIVPAWRASRTNPLSCAAASVEPPGQASAGQPQPSCFRLMPSFQIFVRWRMRSPSKSMTYT